MNTFFPEVRETVRYEGPGSSNPLAYKYFSPDREVGGKQMSEHLRFAVAYWHTMQGTGADAFGGAVHNRTWRQAGDPLAAAETTLEALFEFVTKLGISHYCFHDRDLAPEGADIPESNRNLERLVRRAEALQSQHGVKLLWGTANLFSHPRYTHGAATNPDPVVFAHAGAQVRRALDATVALGGTGYVFWGGREGYSSLLNTNMKQEREQLARFLHAAVEYGKRIGFQGMYFIEPKPMEPTTHQYDFDAAATLNFLREFDLIDHFMLNLEANHATLAGHSFEHELMAASLAGKLGSLDINRGNPQLGWDTDQFPTDLHTATLAMWIVLKQGGLKYGGLNFDSKLRRGSTDSEDLFHAHIGGIDTFARALLVADKLVQTNALDQLIEKRYSDYQSEMGRRILAGDFDLPQLEEWAIHSGEPQMRSGREEALENLFNHFLYSTAIE